MWPALQIKLKLTFFVFISCPIRCLITPELEFDIWVKLSWLEKFYCKLELIFNTRLIYCLHRSFLNDKMATFLLQRKNVYNSIVLKRKLVVKVWKSNLRPVSTQFNYFPLKNNNKKVHLRWSKVLFFDF